MEKNKLLEELENKFSELKASLGFKTTLEELDGIFFIKDFILKDKFVSDKLIRQLSHRIVELYMGWNEYLHSLIMPNPQNMLNLSESRVFQKGEKEEIVGLMKKIMEIGSRSSLINLNEDRKSEAKFIDDAVNFWKNELKGNLIKIMKKINTEWGEK